MTALNLPAPMPSLIVFGRDNAGKPHASWFDQASAELATKAAVMMNMRAVPVETDALRELVGTLPRGRVFASGRAFTPFIKRQLYDRLVELTRDLLGLPATEVVSADRVEGEASAKAESESAAEAKPETAKQATPPASNRPSVPEDVGLGSLVLATTGEEEGWFEAEVIGSNGAMLTLKWRDYPGEATFVRRRPQLGFLPAAV